MPKIPGQTSPTVAPQPINLPGPRRTYAGQGLAAVGEALGQVGQAVQHADKVRTAEEKIVEDRQDLELLRRVNEARLSDTDGYRVWVGKDSTGYPTRLGVTREFLENRFDKWTDELSQGLSEESRERFKLRADRRRVGFEAELERFAQGELKKERVAVAMGKLRSVTTDAAAGVVPLTAMDTTPDKHAGLVSGFMAAGQQARLAAEEAAKEQGLIPLPLDQIKAGRRGPFEVMVDDSVAKHHGEVLDLLSKNGNVPEELTEAYLKAVVQSGEAWTKKNPVLQQVLSRVTDIATTKRVEKQATDAVLSTATPDGRPASADAVMAKWREKYGTSYGPLEVRVNEQVRKIGAQVEKNLESEDNRGGALDRLIAFIDANNIESLDDPRIRVRRSDDGTTVGVRDIRSGVGQARLARALREPREGSKARDKGMPDGITSEIGKATWRVLKGLPASQQAEIKDLNHDLLRDIPDANERQAIIGDMNRRSATFLTTAGAQAKNEIVNFITNAYPGDSKVAKSRRDAATSYATTRLLEAGKDGNVTREELNAILLDALEAADEGFASRDVPLFLSQGKKRYVGETRSAQESREKFRSKIPNYAEQAATQANLLANKLATSYGAPTRLAITPNGARRILAPGEPPLPGSRVVILGGNAVTDF